MFAARVGAASPLFFSSLFHSSRSLLHRHSTRFHTHTWYGCKLESTLEWLHVIQDITSSHSRHLCTHAQCWTTSSKRSCAHVSHSTHRLGVIHDMLRTSPTINRLGTWWHRWWDAVKMSHLLVLIKFFFLSFSPGPRLQLLDRRLQNVHLRNRIIDVNIINKLCCAPECFTITL